MMAEPADQAARDRIRDDLDTTLFVEAGAGSGKTTALVSRVMALVTTGAAALESIAAITFTEKAAAELRDRIRQGLQTASDTASDDVVAARCRLALDQLDTAAIGTLHSFARRILSEHAIEAGLPPRIDVLDEVTSGIAFERRWIGLRDRLLSDPAIERTLLLLFALDVKIDAFRVLAAAFDDNWDLVASRIPGQAPEPRPVAEGLQPVFRTLEKLCAGRQDCNDPDDKLCRRLEEIETYVARARDAAEIDVVESLFSKSWGKGPSFNVGNVGRPGVWSSDITLLRAELRTAGDALQAARDDIGQQSIRHLAPVLRAATVAAADQRRAQGALEFHDLLVMARELLRSPEHGAEVRSRLHERYQRILLDEFQDTDPIQIELAVLIAADPQQPDVSGKPWADIEVTPGHLFVVGDPKQSIYRFRRADISLFMAAQARYGPEAGGPVELTTNFRTGAPVVEWVNQTFGALFAEPPDVATPTPSQPAYLPLAPVRGTPTGGPRVAVVGREAHPQRTRADQMRAAEARDVAATVTQILAQRWTVDDGSGGWRPARLGDITVLVPARTSLPYLEDELERAGISFRAEASSLVYASRAIRDLLMVLRAVDDPTDHLSIVSALRTPLLGCGDDDLVRWKLQRRGSWNYLAPQPDPLPGDDPVALGLGYLRRIHGIRQWHAPSEVLDLVARDRRAFELGVAERRPRDTWRRLRFVIDQARAWTSVTGGGLRDYLQWVDRQGTEGARVAEAVLPETDDDAVRIMTIHAAKGLEFPITIVSGMSTVPQSRPAAAQVIFPPDGGVGYALGSKVRTPEWEEYKPIDEQMAYDERVRLLYVACTRARDHLVVSLHRCARKTRPDSGKRTNAELLVDGTGPRLEDIPDAAQATDGARPDLGSDPVAAPPPFREWSLQRDAALSLATRPTAIAATAMTDDGVADNSDADPGLQKRPQDMDLPPWLKGRYGTAVGRAVHGVLQTIDLATGDGLEAAVAAQCEAEAVPDRAAAVRRLAQAALASPSVQEASRLPHWREVYVAAPLDDGRLLEGYIDLLYERDDGLVIVDYKTASTADPILLRRRVEGYHAQGTAYVQAVTLSTGQNVAATVFLFLTPTGGHEISTDARPAT